MTISCWPAACRGTRYPCRSCHTSPLANRSSYSGNVSVWTSVNPASLSSRPSNTAPPVGWRNRPVDGGLVEREVPREQTRVRIRTDGERPAQGYPQRIPAYREKSSHDVRDLAHEHPPVRRSGRTNA